SKRIAEYSLEIADIINFPMKRRELLRYAALLHDYGKIAIREGVLYKEGSLTIEEYCKIQEHPAITKSILENINFSRDFKELPQIAGAHHEKLNGTGYPEGLTAKQIPLEARILSIVDVFDAMTSRRPYRDRMEFEIVMDSMESTVGAQLDPDLFSAFKKIKLDRLIQILAKEEEDNSHLLIEQDLIFMRAYDIQQLVDIMKRGAANADERKIMELFYKYYYRQYINGIDADVEKKYKIVSI
ncbi:MAG TPA: HD domain-containing protein, partial [bacterium]|nr:HD domain-containing protein [bacterium]